MLIVIKEKAETWFVPVIIHPRYGDATDLRVTESQQEGPVGPVQQPLLRHGLTHKANDQPGDTECTCSLMQSSCSLK